MARFLLAVLTGILWFVSFPAYSVDWCVWFALAPLLVAVSGTSIRRSLLLGWLAGVVGHCGAFPWVVSAIVRLEGVSMPVAVALSLVFAAYHALQFGIFGAMAAWMLQAKSKVQSPTSKVPELSPAGNARLWVSPGTAVAAAAAWVVLEWLFPKVFPWSLATVLSDRLALVQIVEVTGVWGLSFVIVTVNAALALAVLSWWRCRRFAWGPLVLAATLLLAAWGFGATRLKASGETSASTLRQAQGERSDPSLMDSETVRAEALEARPRIDLQSREEREAEQSPFTIAAVQGNTEPGLRNILREDRTFAAYRDLTVNRAAPSPILDLVIWPETTVRAHLPDDEHFREAIFDVAETLQRPMLIGGLDAAGAGNAEFNSLFVVSPNRTLMGVYHKTRLLPFAETAPFPNSWWRTTGHFNAGAPPKPLAVSTMPSREGMAPGSIFFAPSICYEALFPGFFNQTVRDGAEFLVNLTDDSWFGDGNAPWQHLQGAIFRAVETRRPLVRASNSGISAVIHPSGRITAHTRLFARTVMQATIAPRHARTLYVRWGDWFAWLCTLVLITRCMANCRGI